MSAVAGEPALSGRDAVSRAEASVRAGGGMRRSPRRRRAPRVASVVAWVYAAVSTYPLIWLVMQSFRKDGDILGDPFGLPLAPTVRGYVRAFQTTPLPQYFLNSLLVTASVVVVSVACCVAAGYALSRLRFPGSTVVLTAFVGVLVVPAPVLLLPVFLISKDLGILNSYVGLIAPYSAGVLPIGVYLVKTHFDAIPDSYVEAAELDRATPFQTFRIVMLPLVRPAAATVAVLAFMGAWNEYIYALVSINDRALYTLPIGVADLAGKQFLYGFAPVFAAMVLTSIPVYLAFLLAQRSFIDSVALGGGVKG